MPTGYTQKIADGITFTEFAMGCARAFAPGGELPEVFIASDWHAKKLVEERAKLATLESMTLEERLQGCNAFNANAEESRLEGLRKTNELRERYTEMRAHAIAWTPPSEIHNGLCDFMIKQIDDSIAFDCDTDYYMTPTPVLTPVKWLDQQKLATLNSIEYHDKKDLEERERTEKNNTWLRLLRESLNPAEV